MPQPVIPLPPWYGSIIILTVANDNLPVNSNRLRLRLPTC